MTKSKIISTTTIINAIMLLVKKRGLDGFYLLILFYFLI
ncbi:hypothetical protein BSV1_I16 (plasmid) [Borreliella finlandensis]|uniref:Uncharacterized protein n=1 Tax=Borreliella finlandensis TaxID=498741 RepID=A0A806CJP9_9SPIR|nr:hypothetical protein BSV1_I16 [Borreliella finlandensis]